MVNVLSVSGLKVTCADDKALLNHISLDVTKGERIGLVGTSGSGKSLTAAALCGLLRPPLAACVDHLDIDGSEMRRASSRDWRRLRGKKIFQIFQSPASALTPGRRIGPQLKECCKQVGAPIETANLALERVKLSCDVMGQFPYQLSGGMKQRVLIVMALILRPTILIADEPTTGLDVLTEADILAALSEMLDETGSALIFISHDLRAVSQVANRVLVMEAGAIVEDCPVTELNQSVAPAARELAGAAKALEAIC